MFCQNGGDKLKSGGGNAFGNAAGDRNGGRGDKSLDLDNHGTGAFHNHGKNRAGGVGQSIFEKKFARISDFFKSVCGHRKETGFVGRAEAVFVTAQNPKVVLAVAGEFENGINHVFEEFGAGEVAFFGDVADQNDGDVGGFG